MLNLSAEILEMLDAYWLIFQMSIPTIIFYGSTFWVLRQANLKDPLSVLMIWAGTVALVGASVKVYMLHRYILFVGDSQDMGETFRETFNGLPLAVVLVATGLFVVLIGLGVYTQRRQIALKGRSRLRQALPQMLGLMIYQIVFGLVAGGLALWADHVIAPMGC